MPQRPKREGRDSRDRDSDESRADGREPTRRKDASGEPHRKDAGGEPHRKDAGGEPHRKDAGSAKPRGGASREATPARDGPKRPWTPRVAGPLDAIAHSSDRPAQISGEVRRALQAEIARGLNDPRVQGMISITEVVMTPDLAQARIRVSVLPEARASLTLSGLRAAATHLRRRLMVETRISRVPQLVFEIDDRFKRESELDALIRAAGGVGSATVVDGSEVDASANHDQGRDQVHDQGHDQDATEEQKTQ